MTPHQIALAYALSATTGLRAALTLFAIALAAHFHVIAISGKMGWLASDSALYILAALTVVDLAGDKIPLVDHALHAVHVVFKPVAGAVAAAAVIPGADDPATIALMLIGGGNALAVHGLDASARVASTATTAGLANPLLSLAGDAAALVAIAITFVAPFVVAAIVLLLTILAVRAWRVRTGRAAG
jgi:hypothetical protein